MRLRINFLSIQEDFAAIVYTAKIQVHLVTSRGLNLLKILDKPVRIIFRPGGVDIFDMFIVHPVKWIRNTLVVQQGREYRSGHGCRHPAGCSETALRNHRTAFFDAGDRCAGPTRIQFITALGMNIKGDEGEQSQAQ